MRISKKGISAVLWTGTFVILWEAAAVFLHYVKEDPMAGRKLPLFSEIVSSFAEHGSSLLAQAAVTAGYTAAGFLAGAAAGILLAVVMKLSGVVEKTALPYILAAQMIPILGLAPIVFGLFKDVTVSRIVITSYITFFPVAVNFLSGMKSADDDLVQLMEACGADNREKYSKLLIPYALPYLFTGMKLSAPMAVSASILADTLSARNGIGYIIIYALYGGGTKGQFWPAVLMASVMGLICFLIISVVEYFAVPWKRKGGNNV